MTLQDYFDVIQYKITGGYEYQWDCFGNYVQGIESEGDKKHSSSVVFSAVNQTVFVVEFWNYVTNNVYRWVNPDYLKAYKAEHKKRKQKFSAAGDDMVYEDFDEHHDLLDLMAAQLDGFDAEEAGYTVNEDGSANVQIMLTDEERLALMDIAHERDITLNELANQILAEHLEKLKNDFDFQTQLQNEEIGE